MSILRVPLEGVRKKSVPWKSSIRSLIILALFTPLPRQTWFSSNRPIAVLVAPISAKQKSKRLAMKGVGFLGVAEGDWEHFYSTASRHQQIHLPQTATTQRHQHSPTWHSLHQGQVLRTLDRRTSWAPRRNNTKASAPSFMKPPLLSTSSFKEWVSPSTTITGWSLLRSWALILKELRNLLHVHYVNSAAKLVHTTRALFSTIISSHQETISGQASSPPDPHWSFFMFFGRGVPWYPVPKWLLSLNYCGDAVHILFLWV